MITLINKNSKNDTMKRLKLEKDLLPELTEGQVLEFVVQEYKINRRHVDAIEILSEAAGCSASNFANALADRTSIGLERWAKVVAFTRTNLFAEWSEVVWKKHGL